jgi:hypothetical protein
MNPRDFGQVENLGRGDELLNRFLALEPNALKLLGWPQERPLAINEAEHRKYRRGRLQPRGGECLHDSIYLPAHVLGQMRTVPPTDEEPFVGSKEPANVTNLDQPAIELGIDDEHSRWSNQKVIDVPSGMWNSTVVESLEIGNIS